MVEEGGKEKKKGKKGEKRRSKERAAASHAAFGFRRDGIGWDVALGNPGVPDSAMHDGYDRTSCQWLHQEGDPGIRVRCSGKHCTLYTPWEPGVLSVHEIALCT